jgi:UDP-glucuronate 4-epimerase
MHSKPLSVLVTGSSGFIGSHVVRHLHAAGHRVMALDMMPPKERLPDGVRFYECDIRQGMLPNQGFDAVVHLAALAGVRPSLDRQLDYNLTNVSGTLRLLDHCRRFGTPHFIFASSSSVYGPDSPLPFAEDGPADPLSPYALTKLHAEHWGRLYARQHGLRFLALRFFSVWGPGQRPDLALEAFKRRILAGKPVTIHGDGSQRRDLTHVDDVARAVELALHWPGPGSTVLNIGTGRSHSVLEMLDASARAVHAAPPAVEHLPAHPADVPETLASTAKAAAELGWRPTISFPGGPDSGAS